MLRGIRLLAMRKMSSSSESTSVILVVGLFGQRQPLDTYTSDQVTVYRDLVPLEALGVRNHRHVRTSESSDKREGLATM